MSKGYHLYQALHVPWNEKEKFGFSHFEHLWRLCRTSDGCFWAYNIDSASLMSCTNTVDLETETAITVTGDMRS